MQLPGEPAVTDGADGTRSAVGADVGIVVAVTRTNPMYGHDAPLIRVIAHGEPSPVTAAITRCVGESGSAYLELPDGRLTVVLDLDGMTWVPRARDEGIRD
jgi:2-polyprenyl-6-methoxyphenol hydroxylase-like FAD-dependent oxidoreductase